MLSHTPRKPRYMRIEFARFDALNSHPAEIIILWFSGLTKEPLTVELVITQISDGHKLHPVVCTGIVC